MDRKGTLILHGAAQPVTVSVKRQANAYTGSAVIKQTDFGIKPELRFESYRIRFQMKRNVSICRLPQATGCRARGISKRIGK